MSQETSARRLTRKFTKSDILVARSNAASNSNSDHIPEAVTDFFEDRFETAFLYL